MIAHTPGPWQTFTLVDHDGPPECDEIQIQGVRYNAWQCIASCEWSNSGGHRPSRSEAHANARLIAAAPELLQTAQQLLLWVRQYAEPCVSGMGEKHELMQRDLERAEKAIRNATGEHA